MQSHNTVAPFLSFEKSIAKVSISCKAIVDGEHSIHLESDSWFYINKEAKAGEKVK